MTRHIIASITACALAASVNVFAQGQGQEPAPAQPPPPEVAKETLTGCVAEARTTDGGTAYVLNKVEGGTADMYLLSGSTPTEMATNVNKKVTVTGPVQQPTPREPEAEASEQKVLRPPAVQVESVQVVAETCS